MKYSKQLRKVQLMELKIANEIKRICEKNNIKYFLLWGSLLGAVRHEGFIPWDDDMDFGMLRKDYDEFIDKCKNDLDKNFFLQTWDTDPEFPHSYAKIRLVGTHLIEKFSENSKMNDGIFVDIFPLDNLPDSVVLRRINGIKSFMYNNLLWIKKGMGRSMLKESFGKKIKYILFFGFSKLFSYDYVKKHSQNLQLKYNKSNTNEVTVIISMSYDKVAFPSKWVNELEFLKFESTEFPAFKDRHKYLTNAYGEYMKLPPESKRSGHMAVSVDFGPY